jgi:hypothetical protein
VHELLKTIEGLKKDLAHLTALQKNTRGAHVSTHHASISKDIDHLLYLPLISDSMHNLGALP